MIISVPSVLKVFKTCFYFLASDFKYEYEHSLAYLIRCICGALFHILHNQPSVFDQVELELVWVLVPSLFPSDRAYDEIRHVHDTIEAPEGTRRMEQTNPWPDYRKRQTPPLRPTTSHWRTSPEYSYVHLCLVQN